MKVSLNSLRGINRRYGCAEEIAPNGITALVEKIGSQLGAVEEVLDLDKKYQGIVIAKVVACQKLENSDHLNVCKIDDGRRVQGVERDEQGYVQVVCGAPNVREGLIVAWLPPGSTVPESYGKEPFVLEARTIRGQKSNGMLASAKELALGDNHQGLLEITDEVAPGTSFAEKYGLAEDYLIDIENKMFTHRPDCFGYLGVDREIAGIQQLPFKSPEWYKPQPTFPVGETDGLPLDVVNELAELVPRFSAVAIKDVEIKPSPLWLQIELSKVGFKSINNIVDYTNFFMLETGQPLHAYDYDKVKALDGSDKATLVVRHPKPGEKIMLLNGKQVEPRAEAIMIATKQKLIGIGGVMGGADTEVDAHTKNIIVESATFDMYSIRRTSMAHGIFTDAVTRFTKGQSPLQNLAVLAKIVDEIVKNADGTVASRVIDTNHLKVEVVQRGSLYPPVIVSTDFINARLGLKLSGEEITKLLTNVEFQVTLEGEQLTVIAPFWRTDIEIPEDIVEEVGRLYGYDSLPLELPLRAISPAPKDAMLELKSSIRSALRQAGANELLTYSFVHGDLLDRVGQDRAQAFQLANALSPELQYYRLSLTPSLLSHVYPNARAGYDEFALFELGKAHSKDEVDPNEPEVPKEFDNLALVVTAADKLKKPGAPYYQAKHYLDALGKALGTVFRYEAAADVSAYVAARPYEASRSALVYLEDNTAPIGMVGEFRPAVLRALKLPAYTAGFEIGVMPSLQGSAVDYTSLPRFPKVEQDITLKVATDTSYQAVLDFVSQKIADIKPEHTLVKLSPLGIYQREDDPSHKHLTLRLGIASYDKTLTDAEIAKLLDDVADAAKEKLNAERI